MIKKIKHLGIMLLFFTLCVLPLLPGLGINLTLFIFIGLYTIICLGLVLLMGYAGQISLGHAAFFGVGAYTTTVLTVHYFYSPVLGIFSACIAAGIVAFIIGKPSLKLKEYYLALATLGFGIIINILFNEGGELTGGPSGTFGIPSLSIGNFVFDSDIKFYYLILILVAITMLLVNNILKSRIGRALRAIHGSEVAAEAMGIDTAKYKLQMFVLSGVLAGAAGGLYAHFVTFVSPAPFSYKISIELVLMTVVGGLSSVWGPLLGVSLVFMLSEALKNYLPLILPQASGEFEIVFFGIILVLVMIFLPEGLVSLGAIIREKWHSKKDTVTAHGEKQKGENRNE